MSLRVKPSLREAHEEDKEDDAELGQVLGHHPVDHRHHRTHLEAEFHTSHCPNNKLTYLETLSQKNMTHLEVEFL